jgi:hypothetical protein
MGKNQDPGSGSATLLQARTSTTVGMCRGVPVKCKTLDMIRIRIWIGIKMESRIRIGIKAMPIHNVNKSMKDEVTKAISKDL